jgi:hypothetical protein
MAPNNALGNPTAAAIRRREEGGERTTSVRGRSPRRKQQTGEAAADGVRVSTSDGFGAGAKGASSVLRCVERSMCLLGLRAREQAHADFLRGGTLRLDSGTGSAVLNLSPTQPSTLNPNHQPSTVNPNP